MGRRAARVDANQTEVVNALRRAGASVHLMHAVGQGFPDLCVGHRGSTYLIEVKDGSKPPSARKLTPDQKEWHDAWNGQKAVATSAEEALAIIGVGPLQPGVLVPIVGVVVDDGKVLKS